MRNGLRWLGAVPACALVWAAVACGSQGAPTAAGGSAGTSVPPSVSPSVSPSVPSSGSASGAGSPSPGSPGPGAIPAAVLDAVTGGSSARIDVVTSPGSVLARPAASQARAVRTALSQLPHGSKVLGLSLARVQGFGFGTDRSRAQLAWLVSVDPYGGAYGAGGSLGCGRITYDVELIDPDTGQWLMATSGRQSGMPPLPILGPTPSLAQPSPSCGVPNGHMHQGTPAAY
ncbi:MAG TPA: hypothetical protein VH089_19315 [Streptosporangiaceae bacterium]|nr:hypothetical protein [Streptosporangiaceae bacterium]